MDKNLRTISIEDKYLAPFPTNKKPISITRGKGVYIWDENGKRYLDFTSGWGVTCIGHASSVISRALAYQGKKIIQNPNSGNTYSPARARLLELLSGLLPPHLCRFFFTNSGAEANDAAIKLARKASGKLNVISTDLSFHGRTIGTISATGQSSVLNKFSPLVPGFNYVPFNDIDAMAKQIKSDTAAVILEPIQGEGGINVPSEDYIEKVSELCIKNNAYLIIDEIQTGFWRTGPAFCSINDNVKVDILTMAKGIAGGFPFAAFAMTEEIVSKLEKGDHGGTYVGNPLGCAVSYEVIKYMMEKKIWENVDVISAFTFNRLNGIHNDYPEIISLVKGKGLLIALEFFKKEIAEKVFNECLANGLILNLTQGKIIRIFPALNITKKEMDEGLRLLKASIEKFA